MNYRLVRVEEEKLGASGHLITLQQVPNWFARKILRRKIKEIQFAGFEDDWRHYPSGATTAYDIDVLLNECWTQHYWQKKFEQLGGV